MIWLLLVVYQLKHFFCDYPLQTPYMLGKFKSGNDWILPLMAHAGVHALATFLIAVFFGFKLALALAAFDFVAHFAMDRIKASPNMLGRYKALSGKEYVEIMVSSMDKSENDKRLKDNVRFWWALGLDQGVHHLTHYVIIAFLVGSQNV